MKPYLAWLLSLLLLTSCQLLPPAPLMLSPLPMPARAAMLQGQLSKGDKTQPLNLLVEADQQQVQLVVLNAFGQRSRSLIITPQRWRRERVVPDAQLIADEELITAVLCVLAGPQYTQLRSGQWQGLDLMQDKGALIHHVEHQGDPWRSSSRYQKRSNGRLVFELQWLAAPY